MRSRIRLLFFNVNDAHYDDFYDCVIIKLIIINFINLCQLKFQLTASGESAGPRLKPR